MLRVVAQSLVMRCQSGVTAIEFALIAPVFIMLFMGIIEISMIMFTSSVLESATSNTARLGKTGYVAAGTTRQQEIIDNVAARTAGFLNPALITVRTEVYSNLNQVGQPEPCINPTSPPCPGTPGVNFTDINGNGIWDSDMGSAGLGNAGDIVVYVVSYPWALLTPVLYPLVGSHGIVTLSARSVVKNEPYD
jgi:Flp pilus assembly protein TadG